MRLEKLVASKYQYHKILDGWIKRIRKDGAVVQRVIGHEQVVTFPGDLQEFQLMIGLQDMKMQQALNKLLDSRRSTEGDYAEEGDGFEL